jgi:hypothetical protein
VWKIPNIRLHVERYRFELRHLAVLLIVLVVFQVIIWYVHKNSIQDVLVKTQEWYQQDSGERLANLTTTSLELLLESKGGNQHLNESEVRKIVQDFNIIFSQQVLHQNVREICILVHSDTSIAAIDDGEVLYSYVFQNVHSFGPSRDSHAKAVQLYKTLENEIRGSELIRTVVEGKQTFHIFVPFVPRGEYIGAVYMKNTPDFTFITREMISSYDKTTLIYSAVILVGLLAMFYISSVTLKERDIAQKLFFQEQQDHLAEQITHQKEMLFTKRIYHTHHKAEKVMGFIKEDLRNLTAENTKERVYRINNYANFIGRVIYDMKWYEPPANTFRGAMFRTNINEVLEFVVKNIFCRVSESNKHQRFNLELDPALPAVDINEFVVWEVLEPIIQNSFDHSGVDQLVITIRTHYDAVVDQSTITIADNGKGIAPELLQVDEKGIMHLFRERVAGTSTVEGQHSGYGCYISYEIATQRCGWKLEAKNLPEGGCAFTFTISHNAGTLYAS